MLNDILKTMGIIYVLQGTGEKENFYDEADRWTERQQDYLDGILYPGDRLNCPIYVNVYIENEEYIVIETSYLPKEDALESTEIKSISGLKMEIQRTKEFYERHAEVVVRAMEVY